MPDRLPHHIAWPPVGCIAACLWIVIHQTFELAPYVIAEVCK
ncbi:hypothetical protein HMPREF9946_03106 [Acetobacteraceae bacterium AT-5844]|nr:hypothetical protein HMPREF9946_03106 [Acetobacteraceae bacterium AT-5844]